MSYSATFGYSVQYSSWLRAEPGGERILPREGHSATLMNGNKMFVFGGISYGHIPFNDLWSYDVSGNSWKIIDAKGNLPPRWLHSATRYEDAKKEFLVIFGGVTKNWIPLNDLWILDVATSTWQHPKTISYPPFPRMMHVALLMGHSLFIHGGIANNIPFEDLWIYDFETNSWREDLPSGAYPFAREGHAGCIITPPPSDKQPEARPPYVPPPPSDDLMPLLKKAKGIPIITSRYRKDYSTNRWMLIFGGAGPKPRDTD